jgi:hypothetical protein
MDRVCGVPSNGFVWSLVASAVEQISSRSPSDFSPRLMLVDTFPILFVNTYAGNELKEWGICSVIA